MNLRILGCNGSPYPGKYSSCFLINNDLLIDAGSVASQLDINERRKIKYVLISHMHLDHIKELGFLPPSRDMNHDTPIQIIAPKAIISALRSHIFNSNIWFDYSNTNKFNPAPLIYFPILEKKYYNFSEYDIMAVPVSHTVPTYSYIIKNGAVVFGYSSDTGPSCEFWNYCRINKVKDIIIECSLPNSQLKKAHIDGHLTPTLLNSIVRENNLGSCNLYVFHLKPKRRLEIMDELYDLKLKNLIILEDNQEFKLT
ncbi:MAG: 3',5'-cyclic-nucleotide phosphodiesterase [Candidatus Zixiibacteriota bacterium]|nr:MAG: 3',5'-cyclic-nucleotide phosphodiesterase [candidate division Zixibacteria bacterium]